MPSRPRPRGRAGVGDIVAATAGAAAARTPWLPADVPVASPHPAAPAATSATTLAAPATDASDRRPSFAMVPSGDVVITLLLASVPRRARARRSHRDPRRRPARTRRCRPLRNLAAIL